LQSDSKSEFDTLRHLEKGCGADSGIRLPDWQGYDPACAEPPQTPRKYINKALILKIGGRSSVSGWRGCLQSVQPSCSD